MANPPVDRILDALWTDEPPNSRNIWVILDAARHPSIYSAVRYTSSEKCCLYSGDLPGSLAMAAPYLVQVSKDDRLTKQIVSQGWGDSWGVFFRCDTSLATVRRHLRRFLVVQDQRGKRLVFRYYDPRVLRNYLVTCSPQEVQTMFGPIQQFMSEGRDPETLLRFGVAGGKLTQEICHLSTMETRPWAAAQ